MLGYTFLPLNVFMAWCLVKDRENLDLYLTYCVIVLLYTTLQFSILGITCKPK